MTLCALPFLAGNWSFSSVLPCACGQSRITVAMKWSMRKSGTHIASQHKYKRSQLIKARFYWLLLGYVLFGLFSFNTKAKGCELLHIPDMFLPACHPFACVPPFFLPARHRFAHAPSFCATLLSAPKLVQCLCCTPRRCPHGSGPHGSLRALLSAVERWSGPHKTITSKADLHSA